MKHPIHRLALASALTLSASSAFAFDLHGSLTDTTGLGAKVSQLTGQVSSQAAKGLRQGRAGGDADGFRAAGSQGRSAGDRMGGATPWLTYTHNSGKADTGFNAGAQHLEIDAATFQGGADKVLENGYLVGVSIASERTDITNTFRDTQESKGLSIMPYFGWLISPQLLLDASVGYSDIDHDFFIGVTSDAPVVTNYRSNNVGADRKFAEVNINHFQAIADHTEVSARAGLMWAEEGTDSHTATGSSGGPRTEPSHEVGITQFKLGGQVSHQYAQFTPYAGLTYIRDLSVKNSPKPGYKDPANGCDASPLCTDPEDDKDGWLAVAGVNGMVKEGIFLSAEWVRRYSRESLEDTTLNFSVRVNF